MNVNSIIEKYGYNEELASNLRNIYPYLVSYFKDEQAVFNALNNIPIVFCEDLYDCLVEHDMLGALDEGAIASPDVIRDAFGGHITNPQFKYNVESNSFELAESRQMIALNTKTITDFEPTLIHEICHAVKSYNNQYKVDGNIATEYSGLARRNYSLSVENGVVKRNLIDEPGIGFEEALTELAEERVYSMVSGIDYHSANYNITKEVAKRIFNYGIDDLQNMIFEAQMYHDNSKLEAVFGDSFYEYINMLDKVYGYNIDYNDCETKMDQVNVLRTYESYIENQYPLVDQMIRNKLSSNMDM